MQEIPRGYAHWLRLVAFTLMSARNPDSSPASLSPINRESELRTDAEKLASLWTTAQIIHMVDNRLSAADDSLTFIDAAAVTALVVLLVRLLHGPQLQQGRPCCLLCSFGCCLSLESVAPAQP